MTVLGDLLRGLRGKKSLREVSEKSGVSHNYLRIVEKGVDPRSGTPVEPSPDTLRKLASAYNYDYEKLMAAAGYLKDETPGKSSAEKLIDYLEMELSNEEIKERMTFKVDDITLSSEEVDEFVDWVRVNRAMKKQRTVASSKSEGP